MLFAHRLVKAKLDKQFIKVLDILNKLYVNIPFTDKLTQMPSYAKFLIKILLNKRKIDEHDIMALIRECNTIILNNLLPKQKI